jgi:hypothetical protein
MIGRNETVTNREPTEASVGAQSWRADESGWLNVSGNCNETRADMSKLGGFIAVLSPV